MPDAGGLDKVRAAAEECRGPASAGRNKRGFAVPHAPPLTGLAETIAALLAGVAPAAPGRIPLRGAEGRVLAAPLATAGAVPPRPVAVREGWAVASEALVGASPYAPVFPAWPLPGVTIGDVLPAGTDCVLSPDSVSGREGAVEITGSAAPGEGVRRAGEDAPALAVLREAGERLRAVDVAVGAAAGIEMCVVRDPRMRVLVTGKPSPASDFLQRFGVMAGVRVEHQAFGERTRLTTIFSTPPADLLVMIGDTALARAVLAHNGAVVAEAVALRPGEGAVCGRFGPTPAIAVPPRLEAAIGVALALIRPCLEHLSGARPEPPSRAPLMRKIVSGLGMTEVALARRKPEGLLPLGCGDLTLSAIAAADHWLAVPAESEGFAAGELVDAFRL
ncbi:MAG: molybdopterin-binding protein [Microvirga sp.]